MICSAPGCPRPRKARGLCLLHYKRWRRTEGFTKIYGRPPIERLMGRVSISNSGCWTWTGSRTSGGYGTVALDNRSLVAHRAVYELLIGPIPEGLELDHLCRNRACVNPTHLEPVTSRENKRRVVGRMT